LERSSLPLEGSPRARGPALTRADPARRSLSPAGFHPLPAFLSLSTGRQHRSAPDARGARRARALRLQLQRSDGRTDGPGFPDVARPRFDGRAYATPRIAGGGPRLRTPPEIKRQARRLERRPAEDGDPFAAGRQSDDRAAAPGFRRGRLRRSARCRPDCRCDRRSLAVTAGDIVDVEEQIAPDRVRGRPSPLR